MNPVDGSTWDSTQWAGSEVWRKENQDKPVWIHWEGTWRQLWDKASYEPVGRVAP